MRNVDVAVNWRRGGQGAFCGCCGEAAKRSESEQCKVNTEEGRNLILCDVTLYTIWRVCSSIQGTLAACRSRRACSQRLSLWPRQGRTHGASHNHLVQWLAAQTGSPGDHRSCCHDVRQELLVLRSDRACGLSRGVSKTAWAPYQRSQVHRWPSLQRCSVYLKRRIVVLSTTHDTDVDGETWCKRLSS